MKVRGHVKSTDAICAAQVESVHPSALCPDLHQHCKPPRGSCDVWFTASTTHRPDCEHCLDNVV
eukprot:802341-Rhodomonas_salina.2